MLGLLGPVFSYHKDRQSKNQAIGDERTKRIVSLVLLEPKRYLWRRLWRILRYCAVIYLAFVLMMMFLENKILFPASKYPSGDWMASERLGIDDVWFESRDGTRLHGWIAEHAQPRGVVLFCHGNAGNVTNRADVIAYFRDRFHLTTLVFDYRGYGRSSGKAHEAGILADARAARKWLAAHARVPASDIMLLGRSLGGAVAVDLAVDGGAKALILESTFTSAADVGAIIYPWLPVRWFMRTQLDSLSKIADYKGPLLMSHSPTDEIIPYRLGRQLYDAARCDKQFIVLEGTYHNDPQTPAYYNALEAFLDRLHEETNR